MESSSSRLEEENRKQAELRSQIALLTAQLKTPLESDDSPSPLLVSPKRKQPEPSLLAPATPSPKKRKLDRLSKGNARYGNNQTFSSLHPVSVNSNVDTRPASNAHPTQAKANIASSSSKPGPSTVLAKLADLNKRVSGTLPIETVPRSSAFSDVPQPPPGVDLESDGCAPKRDDRLALIEDLEPGPVDHKPSFDDPHFEQLEPNSGIRLSSRAIPHEDIQDHLRGRFYLSPSRLYSTIRLLPDKQGYDVPVPGDWITIAVVAERGPIKFTRAPVGVGQEAGGNDVKGQVKGKGKVQPDKPSGKKFVNIKLVDFGARSRSASSANGGKAVIRGDAFLTLLLFEADSFDRVTKDDGGKAEKAYKGGSGGAFEAMSKVKEGDVIALLNPKILKPFQRAADSPHPTHNILALTPESASSIAVIGRARDLGMCTVVKRDGKVCGGWCDKRISEVCEWHIQNAVERRRAGRAEFSIGTSGMSSSSAPKRKPAFDPVKKWGLQPSNADSSSVGGATYVISGHIVSGSSGPDSRTLFVGENIGREGQAKAKRKMSSKDADQALKALLERDKEGMKTVMKAREVASQDGDEQLKKGKVGKKWEEAGAKVTGKRKAKELDGGDSSQGQNSVGNKSSYSAKIVKQLGFDPANKAGQRRADNEIMRKKLNVLAAVQSSRKSIALGPRPGQRIRTSFSAPSEKPAAELTKHLLPKDVLANSILPSEGGLDEDLKAFGMPLVGNMIDLDDL